MRPSTWPEQDAAEQWWEENRSALKMAVSSERMRQQERADELEAEIQALKAGVSFEQLARITHVGFTCRDPERVGVRFQVELEDGSCAWQGLSIEEAKEEFGSPDLIQDIEGLFCWVEVSGQVVKFKRMWGSSKS